MSKMRVCPKCGKIESQFIYFCTECGWQTETREMQNDYHTEQVSEKNEIHIEENPLSIETTVDLKEKCLLETIRDSYPNEMVKKQEDEETFKTLRNVEISAPKLTHLVEGAEGYYIDLLCPRCQKPLSYMNWLLKEPVTCPMCNVIFRYDEKSNGAEILYNYTLKVDEYEVSCNFKTQKNYSIIEDQRFYKEKEDTLDEDVNESEDVELDGTFIDVVCRHCSAKLSFFDWQIEDKELMCPICEKTFIV